VTENDTNEYAPTWYCNSPIIIFSSNVVDERDPNIFDTPALPITAPAINVQTQATQLTDDPEIDQYPEGSPAEENASREKAVPEHTR
jgi:hypothetical protein